jgi:hypothetical protein
MAVRDIIPFEFVAASIPKSEEFPEPIPEEL